DYITKPFSPREIVARVKAILRRVRQTVPEQYTSYEIGELMVYPDKFEATLAGQSLSFTRKEFELLAYLIKHIGLVLSRDQLLAKVWDYDFYGDYRIVNLNVSCYKVRIVVRI